MTDETDNFSQETDDNIANDNLGIWQHALNTRFHEAAANQVHDDVRNTAETSDLDRLSKIYLAAKYKHTDYYIIQMLKSGDNQYITKAINKCLWIYDADHIDVINPDYLHHNIFPFMSIKMMKKLLTAISIHVRDEERAIEFFHYCMKNKLNTIGFKLLLFTREEFRKELLLDHTNAFTDLTKKDVGVIKHLIGNSYDLLEVYLNTLPVEKRYDVVFDLQYMYSVNNDKYIELLEKYEPNDFNMADDYNLQWYWKKFNQKLSKNIMINHKKRVLENPRFFVRRIVNNTFEKYLTIDDAKKLAVAFLPATAAEFWDIFYYNRYKFFLKLIPHEEIYVFLKKLFNDRYPNEEFEMAQEFSAQDYHLVMTIEEREEWALRRLKYDTEAYYGLYEYINFETSFAAMKDLIKVTTKDYSRNNMCKILLRSARGDRDLETLFYYYNENHNGESRMVKDDFLRVVIYDTNVFEYDEGCWNAFYNILLGIELYDKDLSSHNNTYKTVTLIYHILNKKDIIKELLEFLSDNFIYHMIDTTKFSYLNKLTHEKRNIIYNYLFDFYTERISECKDHTSTSKVSSRLKRYFNNISGLTRMIHSSSRTLSTQVKRQTDSSEILKTLQESRLKVLFEEKQIKT